MSNINMIEILACRGGKFPTKDDWIEALTFTEILDHDSLKKWKKPIQVTLGKIYELEGTKKGFSPKPLPFEQRYHYLEVHNFIKGLVKDERLVEADEKDNPFQAFLQVFSRFNKMCVLPSLSSPFLQKLYYGDFPTKNDWSQFKGDFQLKNQAGKHNSLGSKVFKILSKGDGKWDEIKKAQRALELYVEKNLALDIILVMKDVQSLIAKKLDSIMKKSIDINQYKAFESYGSRYAGHSNHRVTEDADLMALDDRISNLEQKVEMMGRRIEEDFMKLRRRFHEHKHYSARRHDEHERAQIKAALRYLEKKLLY